MFIKLGIIAVVSVGILMVFSSEINEYFPNTVTAGLESFKLDLNSIADRSLDSTGQGLDSSTEKIRSQISAAGDETLESAGQTLQYAEEQINSAAEILGEELNELKDTSTEFVEENITDTVESLDAGNVLDSIPGT